MKSVQNRGEESPKGQKPKDEDEKVEDEDELRHK